MLKFSEIQISQRTFIHENLYRAGTHGAEYSFANLLFWGEQACADWKGTPLFFSRFGSWCSYLYPQCEDKKGAIEALRADAHARGIPLRLFGLLEQDVQELNELYPQGFTAKPNRDSFDYVYDIHRLAQLHGKKLQAKRNHCNRFEDAHPDYRVLPLTPDLLPRCEEFTARWYAEHEAEHGAGEYDGERIAIAKAFANFSALDMEGIAVETSEGMVAFCMGNRIREDTFDVNFEKALPQINGAYPMVNREFARRISEKYPQIRFLNREDDMGIAGLRRAKESYFPDILLEKYTATESEA